MIVSLRALAICLLVGMGTASEAAAEKWRPVRPVQPESRVQLLTPEMISGQVERPTKTWTRVAPGDTLLVRYEGSGMLRIDARPLLDGSHETFRYALGFAEEKSRRFKRRSKAEGEFVVGGSRATVGELDRQEFDLPADGPLKIAVYGERSALFRVLVKGEVEIERKRPAVARVETKPEHRGEWKFEGSLGGAGYVDNAFRTAVDSLGEKGSAYWPAQFEIAYTNDESLPFEFGASYAFEGFFHEEPVLDERRHRLRLKEEWNLGEWGSLGAVALGLEQLVRYKNETFFGRGADEEFETGSDFGGDVSLRNRFDYLDGRARARIEFTSSESFEWGARVSYARRDYSEDYAEESLVYALDRSSYEADLFAKWEFEEPWALALSVGFAYWDYDEKFARDIDGLEVESKATRLRRWPLDLEIRYRPRTGPRASVAVGRLGTHDLFVGYWDRSTLSVTGTAGWRWKDDHRVDLRVRRAETTYDNSRVDHDPAMPLRDKSSLRVKLEGEYVFSSQWSGLAGWSFDDFDNNNAPFAYEQSRVFGGLVFSW